MSNSNEKSGGIRFDDFVSKVVSDPAKVTASTVLKGYIGRSSEADHIRIYFDEALSNFIDIPEAAIIHSVELKDSILGGSTIWVKAGTEYTYGDPAAEKRSKNKFFDGPVYQDYVTNVKPPDVDGSISFQYCISTACSNICSDSCISFQYCITSLCTQSPVEEAYNANTPMGSISFQYCISTACSNICSGNCITFQYCITRKCTQPPVEEAFKANGPMGSISYQYCMSRTCTDNCSQNCITFQYCLSETCPQVRPQQVGTGRFNQGFNPNPASAQYCGTQQAARFNNYATQACGFGGGFNPYRGY